MLRHPCCPSAPCLPASMSCSWSPGCENGIAIDGEALKPFETLRTSKSSNFLCRRPAKARKRPLSERESARSPKDRADRPTEPAGSPTVGVHHSLKPCARHAKGVEGLRAPSFSGSEAAQPVRKRLGNASNASRRPIFDGMERDASVGAEKTLSTAPVRTYRGSYGRRGSTC